jgi:hypothetical protein
MSLGDPRRFELEVQFDQSPIRGRISEHERDGDWHRFAGWLGLLSAIEAASATGGWPPADTGPDPKRGEDE